MKRSTTGLRARLLLLVLFAVIPAFALIAYTTISQRQQAAETAKNGAMNLVRLADNEHGRLIDSTRQVLLSISQLPAVRELRNATACSQMLAGLQKAYPYYTNIGVATLDGNLFCNSRPFARTINIADRSYFRRTVASRDFGIGDYQIGRVTGEPAINFGYPVFDAAGKFHAVAYVALNLSWLNQLITGIDLPAGSVLFVVDSSGTILTRPRAGEVGR